MWMHQISKIFQIVEEKTNRNLRIINFLKKTHTQGQGKKYTKKLYLIVGHGLVTFFPPLPKLWESLLESYKGCRSERAGLCRLRKQTTEAKEGLLELRRRKGKSSMPGGPGVEKGAGRGVSMPPRGSFSIPLLLEWRHFFF